MGHFSFALVSILILSEVRASIPEQYGYKSVSYKTSTGDCPEKASSMFTLAVMKEFEKNHSLRDVKQLILTEKLDERHYLSDYKISYNPVAKSVRIGLTCPEPLAKVQVYRSNGEEHYSAILGDNARLYEPGFENLMRAEKRLKHHLPLLALGLDQMEGSAPVALAKLIRSMEPGLRSQISEIIMNKAGEVTIVFALGRKATSVFIGGDQWDEKTTKLAKIVSYVTKSRRYPSSINLVNLKKVVVKFSDNI